MVLIVIDTLAASHVGSYGYPQPTTPELDALAARGLRFARASAQVPVTQPSVSTILTGRLPFHHGVRDNQGFVLDESEITLAERAREAGYRTAAVVASSVLSKGRGLEQGFELYDDEFEGDYPIYDPSLDAVESELRETRRRADRVSDRAIELLDGFGDDPTFLFVHYFDPHAHYDPPPAHRERFEQAYDGELHFVDAEIGRLLRAIDPARRTLVAVVSDHGEAFGEHGEIGHGFLLHETTLHVPFLLAGDGIAAGQLREDLVGLVDLEPTLASCMKLAPAELVRDGRDLLSPSLQPADQYAETLRTLLSYNWAPLRALRRDDLKWIEGPQPRFYDLASDPAEIAPVDLADPRALELRDALRRLVADDDARAIKQAAREVDPDRLEQLAALGYVGGAEQLPAPMELPDPAAMLPTWNRRQSDRALYRQAVTLLQLGRLPDAVALLDTLLAHQPTHVAALHNRGTALLQLGQLERARRDWRRAIELDPEYVPALRSASEDHLRSGDFESALGMLDALTRLQPNDPAHALNLGLCADRLGRTGLAEAALRRFLELAPTDDPRRDSVRQWLAQHGKDSP